MIKQMSNEEYHAEQEHYSSTEIKDYLKSPVKAQAKEAWEQTESMLIGSAMHAYLESDDQFDKEFSLEPLPDGRTNIGKLVKILKDGRDVNLLDLKRNTREWKEEATEFCFTYDEYDIAQEMLQDKRTRIKPESADIAFDMAEKIKTNPLIKEYFQSKAQVEESFFTEVNGLKVKVRPDRIVDKTILDWKSIYDFTPDNLFYDPKIKIKRQVEKFGYGISGAMYLDVVSKFQPVNEFILVFCESHFPHQVCVVRLKEETIEKGREMYLRGIDVIKQSLKLGHSETFEGILEI